MHRVEGKGLSGFIFGLLFATAAIGGVLYFLNHTPSGIREEARNPVEKAPEVLTPKGAPNRQVAAAPVRPASEPLPAPKEVRVPLEQPKAVAEVAADTAASDAAVRASEPRGSRQNTVGSKPAAVAEAENGKPAQTAARRRPEPVAEAENKAAGRRAVAESADKPAERRIAETKTDDNRTAAPPRRRQTEELAETARRPAPSAAGRGSRIVQMGAYGSAKAADAQQAKLALMGISTQVERATAANGQTVYRVHSGGISAEEARKISRVLNDNGVEHITRSAR